MARTVTLGLIAGGWSVEVHAQAQDIVVADPVQPEQMQPRFEINQATFDQWVYGNRLRNSTAAEYLESLLEIRLTEVVRACKLDEGQARRLRLAGLGDIKRFHDRITEVHADFDRFKFDQARMNDLFQQAQPLAAKLNAGLYGDGSFFSKAIGTTLTAEQREQARAAERAKALYRYKSRVLLAVATLDTAVGFAGDQQQRYVAAILAGSTPPERSGGQYEANVTLLKIAQVPEADVRAIFDDDQWAILQKQFVQARSMEPFLRANGHLGGKATAPDKSGAVPGDPRFQIQIDRVRTQ